MFWFYNTLMVIIAASYVHGFALIDNPCKKLGVFPLVDKTPEYYGCFNTANGGMQLRYLSCDMGQVFDSSLGYCVAAANQTSGSSRANGGDIENPTIPTLATTTTTTVKTPDNEQEDTTTTEKPEDTTTTEKPEDTTTTEKYEGTPLTEKPEDTTTTEKYEGTPLTEKPEDTTTTEKHEATLFTENPEDSTTTEKEEEDTSTTEKEEDTSTTEKEEDTSTTEKEEDTTTTEKGEDTTTTEKEEDTTTTEKVEDTTTTEKEEDTTTTEPEIPNNLCENKPSSGFFPYEKCNEYLICVYMEGKDELQGFIFQCPGDLQYNDDLNFCDTSPPCEDSSLKQLKKLQQEFECEVSGTYAYPGDCNKYFSCWWNVQRNAFESVALNCPVGEVYDITQAKCSIAQNENTCRGR